MLDANRLRGEIARNGLTQKAVAEAIGMTPNTFCVKLRTGSFGLAEAEAMIDLLGIEDPAAIFFGGQ